MKNTTLLILSVIFSSGVYAASAQNNYIYRFPVGEYEVVMLSDSQREGNSSILIGATDEIKRQTMPGGTFPNAVNYFLVITPRKNYIIDTGTGARISENLDAAGVAAADIGAVLLTHLHGDHTGGLRKGEYPMFPNAVLQISAPEFKYWTDDNILNAMPESQRRSFTAVRDVIKLYEKSEPVITPEPLAPAAGLPDGIHPIAAYGHTSGHTAYLVVSKGEKLLIWGDLTHAMAVQMPYPEISVTYDVDPVMAAGSRLRLLKFAADNKIPVAGMHIAYPGVGTIEKVEPGYKFTPYRF